MNFPKFRIWHKYLEKFFILQKIHRERELVACVCDDVRNVDMRPFKFEDVIFEMSTGYLDKNGKEIFEGDILNSRNDGCDGCDAWDYRDHEDIVVDWKNGFDHVISRLEEKNTVYNISRIEIIGNIHEMNKSMKKHSEAIKDLNKWAEKHNVHLSTDPHDYSVYIRDGKRQYFENVGYSKEHGATYLKEKSVKE